MGDPEPFAAVSTVRLPTRPLTTVRIPEVLPNPPAVAVIFAEPSPCPVNVALRVSAEGARSALTTAPVRLVKNQVAHGPDQSAARLVSRRAALHRRFCSCDVTSRWRGYQSRHSGCRRYGQPTGRKIANRSGFRERFATSAGASRMADTAHPGDASFHPSESGDRSDFAAQRLIADRVSSVEMVSSSATNSRPVHRHRAEAGTLP